MLIAQLLSITIPILRFGDTLAKCDLCHIVITTEKRDTAMQHIIEGFLNFQKEIFPQRKELFRSGVEPES